MRDIKSRSWNKDLNQFFYFLNGRYYNSSDFSRCISERICSEFIWRNSEQFIGLTDENDIDIYEGDTYEADLLCIKSRGSYWVKCVFVVRFVECGFKGVAIKQLSHLDMKFKINGSLDYLKNKVEVISNIHQNKELLK